MDATDLFVIYTLKKVQFTKLYGHPTSNETNTEEK